MPYKEYGPFHDVHPTHTGRRPMGALKGVDLPTDGAFPSMIGPAKPNESRWIRCYQCGFPVDTERDITNAEQPAISFPETTMTSGDQTSVVTQDCQVNAGCPLCGADSSAYGPQGPSR